MYGNAVCPILKLLHTKGANWWSRVYLHSFSTPPLCTQFFFRADSRVKMWRFTDVSGRNRSPSSRCIGSLENQNSNTLKNEEGVSCRKVRQISRLDAAVCCRKFNWIPSRRKLQDMYVSLLFKIV